MKGKKQPKEGDRFHVAKDVRVKELTDYYDGIIPEVEESIQASAISSGRPLPSEPSGLEDVLEYMEHGDPLLPDDLTIFSDVILGKLFSFFNGWCNYVQAELTRSKCAVLVIERKMKVISAALSVYYKDDMEMAANLADDKVTTDERYCSADSDALKAKTTSLILSSKYDQLKRDLTLISREQTRRSEEISRVRHEGSGRDSGSGGKNWSRGKNFRRK